EKEKTGQGIGAASLASQRPVRASIRRLENLAAAGRCNAARGIKEMKRHDAHAITSCQVAGEAPGPAGVLGAPDKAADDVEPASGDPAVIAIREPDCPKVRRRAERQCLPRRRP